MTPSDPIGRTGGPPRQAAGRPYHNVRDPRPVSMLGIGLVAGAVIGAGIALLLAPESGSRTRRRLLDRADRLRGGGRAWTRLGRELKRAAAARRKAMELEARKNEIAARTS